MSRSARIAELRARIRAIEGRAPEGGEAVAVAEAIDAALPWGGLPRGCVHEVTGEDGAATGFCAFLAGRLARRGGAILWCLPQGQAAEPYAPGLAAFGLPVERLIVLRCRDEKSVLWAMEEALRCTDVAAVVAEPRSHPDLTAARRLQLAAEAGGAAGLLLVSPTSASRGGGGATTRWLVTARPSEPESWGGLGRPCWHLALEHCRGALPRTWTVWWNHGALVAGLPSE